MRVYVVQHKDSGKLYVGATTRSLDERMARHFVAALTTLSTGPFYEAIRACGISAFDWRVLRECSNETEMWEYERESISALNSRVPNGYNQTHGGPGGGWELGRKRGPMSDAEREKRSRAGKGRPAWNKGIPHSYIARQKMRGRKVWNKGIPRTEAEKAKMREAIRASLVHGDRHPKCKQIECDGVTYQSVREMERRTGMSRAGIYYRLSHGRARFIT